MSLEDNRRELDELRAHFKMVADLGMTEDEHFFKVVLPNMPPAWPNGYSYDPDNPDGTLFGSHYFDD